MENGVANGVAGLCLDGIVTSDRHRGMGLAKSYTGGSGSGAGGTRFWVLAFALLLLNGLGWFFSGRDVRAQEGQPDSARLLRMEPLNNLEKASEIKLVFDRSMVQDVDVGVALTVSPFHFEPEVEGRWRWTATGQLSFELEEPLPLGHKYRLVPHVDFAGLTGFTWDGDATIDLQTQGLILRRGQIQSSEPGVMTFAFDFNQSVSSEDLAAALSMHGDNRVLDDWSVLSKAPTDSHLVQLKYNPDLDIKQIGYVIDKQLCGHGAEVPMFKNMSKKFFVPLGFTAMSVHAYPSSTDNTCSVSIRFNEYLSLGQENPEVTFTPEVECTEPHVSGSNLRLTGEFLCGQTYTVQIGESLLSSQGGTLGKKVGLQFKVPARSPRVSMPEGNGLLMPDGELRLGLRVTNIQNLEVSTTRLHANNLVSHLHHNSARETSQAKKTKRYELDLDANVVTDSSLSLRDLIEEPLGVYQVSARNKDSYWNRDSSLVRVSDLALTVKREKGGLFVWVTSLSSGQPLQGVALEARTQNNQILGAARSSKGGVAHIVFPEELPDGGAFVVSATLGRDFAYLQPDRGTWVFDKVDTAGKNYAKGVNAWLYTERGVYRPGETIHLTGLLRNPDGGFAEESHYEVRLQRPDGRIDWRGKLQDDASPDGQGLFQIDLPTRAMGPTGVHTVVLWDGKASEVRRRLKVNVEDFVATRLEVAAVASVLEAEDPAEVTPVEATSDRAPELRATANETSTTAAGGTNLRASAAPRPSHRTRKPKPKPRRVALQIDSKDFLSRASKGLAVRVLPHWKRLPFKSALLEDYSFTEPTKLAKRSFQGGQIRSKLNNEGCANVQLSPSLDNAPGLWQLRAASTITEVGGRSVTHTTTTELDTANHHLGFRLTNGAAPVAEPMQIDWAVVTRDDKTSEAVPYKVRLERVVHQYGMKQVNGRLTWQREIRHEDVERFQIGQDGASGALNFKVLESGSYRLLAEQVGGRGVAEFTFYAGSGAPAHTQTDPQLLELTLDSAAYEPGDMAGLEVRGQFDGQLLITLESDRVLTSQVLDFKAPAANLQIQLPEDLRGGAFFSASLIRGIDPTQTSWLPHRARGLVRVKTTHMGHILPLALQAPKRVAPGETVTIHASSGVISLEDSEAIEAGAALTEAGQAEASPEVPAGRPARLHVWAVDTGVLLATGEKLPDPHAHFFAQHKSGVGTVDSWAHLLPDHMRADSVLRIGGDTDSEEAMARRLAALPPTQRSSGVAWSRAVDMGPDGTIGLDLEMPNIRGAVTLRAVLVDGDSYACSEQRIELATDLQVTATWPRYSTSGDKLRVPVKLLNTTDAPMEARLEASTEGPITFAPERGYQPLQLAANEEVLVWFLAETPEPGTAQIELSAVRSAGIDSIQTEFQVRPATAFHQET
ncbi:MAG: hypothetical protein GY930_00035, partial [bacterium]|nr:hypothetical protein [bacterium]